MHSVQSLVEALMDATGFDDAAQRVLQHLLSAAGAGFVEAPRAMLVLTAGERPYRVSSDPAQQISATAIRAVRSRGVPVLIDIGAGTVTPWRDGFGPGEPLAIHDFESRQVVAQRATHLLAIPLRREPTRVDGAVVLELDSQRVDGVGAALPRLQAMADVARVMLPRHGRRAALDEQAGVPVLGETMRALLGDLRPFAESSEPLLLGGEPGVGKSMVAEWIHRTSPRRAARFAAWDGTAVAGLAGATLVGWGAGADRPGGPQVGLLEQIGGGTVFIDHVDRLAPRVQRALVSVLDEGRACRLGESRPRPIRARVVCGVGDASQLAAHVDRGAFDRRLFDHLAWAPVTIPPLRQRPDEVVPWARYYLARWARREGVQAQLAVDAESVLAASSWPENLKSVSRRMRRALQMAGSGTRPRTVRAAHLAAPAVDTAPSGAQLLARLRATASAFVDLAERRPTLGLAESRVFEKLVLETARDRHGKREALRVLGRAADLEGDNHHRLFKRSQAAIAAFVATVESLGPGGP